MDRGRGTTGETFGPMCPSTLEETTQPDGRSAQGKFRDNANEMCGKGAVSGSNHGFLRQRNGNYTTFDVPGAVVTQGYGINDSARSWGHTPTPRDNTMVSSV